MRNDKATFGWPFSFVLNHLLDAEPAARERLAPFAGEVVEVRAPPLPALTFTILPGGRLEAGGAGPALVVTLKPELLAALGKGEDHLMRAVEVSGDPRLASEAMWILRHMRAALPEIAEEDLSRVFGDIAAHRLAQGARDFLAWQADARRPARRRVLRLRHRGSAPAGRPRRARRLRRRGLAPARRRRAAGKADRAAWLGWRAWRASSPSACASGCTSSSPGCPGAACSRFFQAPASPVACGCAKRSRRSARSSSSSARSCRPAATCCRSTSPMSSPSCRTRCRRFRPTLAVRGDRARHRQEDRGCVRRLRQREPIASASIAQVHLARLHGRARGRGQGAAARTSRRRWPRTWRCSRRRPAWSSATGSTAAASSRARWWPRSRTTSTTSSI